MAWTIDSALNDDLITVLHRDDDAGYYELHIGELETPVWIDLGRYLTSDKTKFSTSHSIHTPEQMGPYKTSTPFGDDPAYALHRAISGITDYYREAVSAGHEPKESWLVSNA